MTLFEFLGPWLYWPMVVVVVSGSVTWTLNCISVTYSEVSKQIAEVARVRREPYPPACQVIERETDGN